MRCDVCRSVTISVVTLEHTRVQAKSEAAYATLREAILDGRLAPGSRVTLQGLADDLGMSLTPIREALRLLGSQGLVEHNPNRGTHIASLSRSGIEEIYQLRCVLEPLACELAAKNATTQDLARIDIAMSDFDAAVEGGMTDDLPMLNAALHRSIYLAAGSTVLLEFIDRLWVRIPYQAMSLVRHHDRSTAEHHLVVDAVRTRQAKEAGQLMWRHITNSTQETISRHEQLVAVPLAEDQ